MIEQTTTPSLSSHSVIAHNFLKKIVIVALAILFHFLNSNLVPKAMATRFACLNRFNGIKSQLQNFTNTFLHFYDMEGFQKRLKSDQIHPITEKIQGCGLGEVASFLVAV